MSDKIPELTLEATAAEVEVPTLTLEPEAPETPVVEEKKIEPVELDEKLLTEEERAAVAEFSKKIDVRDTNMILQYGARVSAHDLNYVTARVGLAGIAQAVDHGERRVHCGIKADGIIRRGDVVIDGSGDADAGDTACGKIGSTAEGAVAADGNDAVNADFAAGSQSLLHTLFRLELRATVGVKNGAATVQKIGNVARGKLLYVVLDQTRVTAIDRNDLNAASQSRAGYGTDSRIHTGCVTAGSKNADFSEFVSHNSILLH